ncbi:mechanosensitive ion channel family protein [Sporolactobacillus sp. THM7-4]|nr:mechanosensitive ion channel family protein [Sporolactobacillus sp. THM7-4]
MLNNFEWIMNVTWMNGLIALGIFIIFFIIRKLFSRYFLKLVTKLSRLNNSNIDEALFVAFRKPVSFLLLITGIYLSLTYLPLPDNWEKTVTLFFKSGSIFVLGWGFYIFSDAIGLFFNRVGSHLDVKFNEIVIPFLSKIIKFIVTVLTISMILDQWNYHVTGIITGLGIGGLAVAMAAKDTLANLFGGFVIITDTPFTIGDFIQSGSIEGVVEDINFRSTRIRTVEQALITVPNSTLANQPITNLSKMEKRRFSLNIELDVQTPGNRLSSCTDRIRRLLSGREDVDPQGILVYFDKLSSSSINLMIQCFTRTTDLDEWLKIKERFNLAILDILSEEGVDLATNRPQMVFSEKNGLESSQNQSSTLHDQHSEENESSRSQTRQS